VLLLLYQGFAYIEFLEADAVDNAIMLDNSELRGRQIKVSIAQQAVLTLQLQR
jgi:polyadenylate-binding protein 2